MTSCQSQRLADLGAYFGGDVYLTGTGSRDYLEEDLFAEAGIGVEWREFDHPIYPQLHGDFEPGLSVLDWLMMCGEDPTRPEREAMS